MTPNHRFYALVLALAVVVFAFNCFDPVAHAQDKQETKLELEQRINAYQQGDMPEGPTKKELKAEVEELKAEVSRLKADLKACRSSAQ